MSRTIAFGDIHGMYERFEKLLIMIDLRKDDKLIFLGDYCDRGPNTKAVVDKLISIQLKYDTVFIKGNHEEMLLSASNSDEGQAWLGYGGWETLESYGGSFDYVPDSHMIFYEDCVNYHEEKQFIYVHAGVNTNLDMSDQNIYHLRWSHVDNLTDFHKSGKVVICGHSSQKSGNILDREHVICIDTWCCGGKNLTAFDPYTRQVWQVDGLQEGHTFIL